MKDQNKQKIAIALKKLVAEKGSQSAVANSMLSVSSATINHMINGKWDLIADDKWRVVANQMKWKLSSWKTVQTNDFNRLSTILADAQSNSMAFAVTAPAGSGKTNTSKVYVSNNKNAYILQCSEFWNRKYFLSQLLSAMGRDAGGYTVAQMMTEIVRVLKSRANPLIIMDEADKLSDQVLYFFITLYNQLEDSCGLVLLATDHLEKRIRKGLKINKKGYKEIYSRIGRKFIELNGVGQTDVIQVCKANGVEKDSAIGRIFKDCENDLRRVKRLVFAYKMSA